MASTCTFFLLYSREYVLRNTRANYFILLTRYILKFALSSEEREMEVDTSFDTSTTYESVATSECSSDFVSDSESTGCEYVTQTSTGSSTSSCESDLSTEDGSWEDDVGSRYNPAAEPAVSSSRLECRYMKAPT